jgi:hypothetical protein
VAVSLHFIESTQGPSQSAGQGQRAYEPMFDRDSCSSNELPRFLCLPTSIGKLARVIHDDPSDALCHVQRIRLARSLGETDQVTAAMYDLGLALQRDPQGLGKRIKELGADDLVDARHDSQAMRVPAGPPPPGSVLRPLAVNPRVFMTKTETSDARPPSSVVGRAESLILEGRIDSARDLLEQTVMDDPADQESIAVLLFLYRSNHDRRSFSEMRATIDQLLPGATGHDPLWRGTEAYFDLMTRSTKLTGRDDA